RSTRAFIFCSRAASCFSNTFADARAWTSTSFSRATSPRVASRTSESGRPVFSIRLSRYELTSRLVRFHIRTVASGQQPVAVAIGPCYGGGGLCLDYNQPTTTDNFTQT